MTRIDRDDDAPIDFGPLVSDRLDPERSAARWAALVGRIEAAAAPELARRAARAGSVWVVDSVTRAVARFAVPALIAAAVALIAVIGTAESTPEASGGLLASQAINAEVAQQALSLDAQHADWIARQQAPSADDLARAIDPTGGSDVGEQE